jgi:hypothetical protein
MRIETTAFAECRSLKAFDVPKSVQSIGQDYFKDCISRHRLGFTPCDSLKKFLGGVTLSEALKHFGLTETSSQFTIQVDREKEFPGWVSDDERNSNFTLLQEIS